MKADGGSNLGIGAGDVGVGDDVGLLRALVDLVAHTQLAYTIRYYTYACRSSEEETDEANILKTPKQPALCPGSFASAEAVAHIMVQKFVMLFSTVPFGAGV